MSQNPAFSSCRETGRNYHLLIDAYDSHCAVCRSAEAFSKNDPIEVHNAAPAIAGFPDRLIVSFSGDIELSPESAKWAL